MLNKNDFKSIWEVAHRWEEIEPSDIDPPALNEGVNDKIQKLIWAFRREQLILRNYKGLKVSHPNQSIIDVLFIDWTFFRLNSCLKKKHFPRLLLDRLFVMRSDLLTWCDKDWIEAPEFWDDREKLTNTLTPQGKPLFGRHQTEETDKNRCQAIALTLWGLDPSIHPAHMAKSKAMQIYGNGRSYKGKDEEYETVKKWIKEVDPLRGERKDGKPPKVNYPINLETHHLERDQISNTY